MEFHNTLVSVLGLQLIIPSVSIRRNRIGKIQYTCADGEADGLGIFPFLWKLIIDTSVRIIKGYVKLCCIDTAFGEGVLSILFRTIDKNIGRRLVIPDLPFIPGSAISIQT